MSSAAAVTPAPTTHTLDRDPDRVRLQYVYALAIGVAVAHLIVAIAYPGSLATGWLINAAFVAGALLCLWRAASSRSDRAVWSCVGVGLLFQAFGNRYYRSFLADDAFVSQPSVADLGYLAFYPLAGCAIVLLLGSRLRSDSFVLDATVATLAVLSLVTALVLPDALTISGGDLGAILTNLAYPIADLVLLGLLVGGTQLVREGAGRAFGPMALAMSLFVIADLIYLSRVSTGSYEPGGPLDAFWSFAAVALGIAAWQTDARHRRRVLNSSLRTIVVVVAVLAAIALLVWDHYHRVKTVAVFLAAATMLAALARLVVALVEQQRATRAVAEAVQGTERRVVRTFSDVTAEHEARALLATSESRYRELALHDPLTGLANRALFTDRLQYLLERRGPVEVVTVVMIDLDEFKAVNDAFGHRAGDDVLNEVARRLVDCTRPEDTVARLGGDEFGVVMTAVDAGVAGECGERLATALSRPYELEGRVAHCTASVGIAVRAGDDEGVDALLLRADLAQYDAKTAGGGRCTVYDDRLDTSARLKRTLTADLSVALAEHQLVVHYQPIADLTTGQIAGFEALVRWQHPTRGLLAPDAFLGLAAEAGSVVEIGRFVLDQATRTAAHWNACSTGGVSIGVNLSAPELADDGVVDAIACALDGSGLNPHRLVIEVTEETLVTDIEKASSTLARIRGLGVRIALDDFGAGYSALGYLRDLPAFSILKIDRRLVSGEHPRERAILASTVALGHSLTMEVVAEGLEDATLHAVAKELGCEFGQGWLLGRPTDAAEAGALLASEADGSGTGTDHRAPVSRGGERHVNPPATSHRSRKIVVIEDDLRLLDLLGTQLRLCGYEPLLALTAEEGERLTSSERPELVLIDLNMPGTDGSEAARAIRIRPELRDIPLVAYSSMSLDAYRGGTASEWFDGQLKKWSGGGARELGTRIEAFLADHAARKAGVGEPVDDR